MGKGYWVACVNVKNQEEFNKYVNLAGPAVKLHGGKFLARGNNVFNIEGKKLSELLFQFLIQLKKLRNVIIQMNIRMH